MNTIEKALVHALFVHPHHNIDKTIDFKAIEALTKKVGKINDDKEVFEYKGQTVAVIPNCPSQAELDAL